MNLFCRKKVEIFEKVCISLKRITFHLRIDATFYEFFSYVINFFIALFPSEYESTFDIKDSYSLAPQHKF